MADQFAGKSIDIDPFQMIKLLAVKTEDGRAIHHPNAGAIVLKILPLMTDLTEAPEPSCACWTQIARRFGHHAGYFGCIQTTIAKANGSNLARMT